MISKIKNILKKNHFLHFLVTFYRDEEFRRILSVFIQIQIFKEIKKIARRELKLIRDYWGCPPYHYYLYNLYRKELSDDQLLDYIPPFYYYCIYWEKRNIGLNKSSYWSKVFQHQLFKKYNIPSMDIVGIIQDGELLSPNNESLRLNEFIESYLRNNNDALFIKPEYGRGGKGISLLTRKDGTIFLNYKPTSVEKIIPSLIPGEKYIVEERFKQSRQMSEINNYSVNTLRIGTKVNNDETIVSFCMLRMGTNNSFVDNMSARRNNNNC